MMCLVTGAHGFIGSHVTDRLIQLGHKVVAVDNHSAVSNDRFYTHHKSDSFIEDVCDYDFMAGLFRKYKFDYVFHLAAIARIQLGVSNPVETAKTNYVGTQVLLDLCNKHGIKKFIFSSTSSSYGLINKIPLNEDMEPDCLTPYSVAKVASEKLCQTYFKTFNVPTISLRYFNVYGEREPIKGEYAPVVGLFLRQRKECQPLTVVGDGEQTRDFTYIKDAVAANILAMDSDEFCAGETFNIGTGQNYSILEIARTISQNIKYIPERVGESRDTQADISKAKRLLNYSPKYNLINYIKDKLND